MTTDIIRELTPHTLTAEEGAAVRAGFDLALRTRYEEAHVAVCDLSEPALRDVLLAMDIFGSVLRFELAGRTFDRSLISSSRVLDGNDRPTVEQVTIAALAPDSLIVPCPRCGHDEHHHENEEPGTARCCLDCKGFCSPVLVHVGAAPIPLVIVDAEVEKVPAHVQGWAIDGRAAK